MFNLKDYQYDLPSELIAQEPLNQRDDSRLMVVSRASGSIQHRLFKEIGDFLVPGDVCVANHSRVIAARLLGNRVFEEGSKIRGGGQIEFLLLKSLGDSMVWEGICRSSARQIPGLRFKFEDGTPEGLLGEIIQSAAHSDLGTIVVRFNKDPSKAGVGKIPLPPYIVRQPSTADLSRYQTVYAREGESSAAPTAGLHFTPQIISGLINRNVGWTELNLNVGLGTFRPIKVDDVRNHRMHAEFFSIPERTIQAVKQAKEINHRVLAVGTTSLRALESSKLISGQGQTDLFVYPGWGGRFEVVDCLLTNFHLSASTLLLLVCAFGGKELVLHAYQEAVREKYRFFSYGDAMLVI